VGFVVFVNGLSAYLLEHHSLTYRRVSNQLIEAAGARPTEPGQPASIVMIGNSLFLDGVQVDRLQDLTSNNLRIYPIFLEGTGYYDWLYALRRIFSEGARPQVVVVQLEVNSFLWKGIRTEYSPMLFFDAADLLRVGSDLGFDRTAKSSLLLAHWSAFWGAHSIVRTQILRHAIPRFGDLFALISTQGKDLMQTQRNIPIGPEFEAIAETRLKSLQGLCKTYGATMVMLVPPTPSSEDGVQKLERVSQRIGVTTWVPIDPTALTAQHYSPDALHLNSEGAALFTLAIARTFGHLYKSEKPSSARN